MTTAAFKTTLVLIVVAFLIGATAVMIQGDPRLVMNDRGYEPVQPIAFSHQLHAGELGIGCLHCHPGVEKSRHAGIPSVATCMNCHRFIHATQNARRIEEEAARREDRPERPVLSAEIAKIHAAAGWRGGAGSETTGAASPIAWTRVHNLPDFVYFDHSRHVNAGAPGSGVACAACHGPVESMERIRQVGDFTMGSCLECHRRENLTSPTGGRARASLDCAACHF